MDKFMDEKLTKLMVICNTEERDLWKRAEFMKVVDEIYMQGFADGEHVTKNIRVTSDNGRRFKIKRSDLDFASFNLLCHRLRVRLDAEGIDFIGFDVGALKQDGTLFQDTEGLGKQKEEPICQAVNTLLM